MSFETWRPVIGFERTHEVSNTGRVRRVGSSEELHPWTSGYGYPKVALRVDGQKTEREVHILVAEAFIAPRPSGLVANHKNGVKTDNRPENLEWVTRAENNAHALRTGLWPLRTVVNACGNCGTEIRSAPSVNKRFCSYECVRESRRAAAAAV
jgi:hypothetical protein